MAAQAALDDFPERRCSYLTAVLFLLAVRPRYDGVNMKRSANDLVSIIIPCYNQGHSLRYSIESALRQTYARTEIIVVDDGSTDNTTDVVAHYTGIKILRQTNLGVSAARNAGLRSSNGNYVIFLDADDCLFPNAIEAALPHFNKPEHHAIVFGECRPVNFYGEVVDRLGSQRIGLLPYADLLRKCPISCPAMAVHRRIDVVELGGFDEMLAHCETYDLYLRTARVSSIFCHGEIVCEYRRYPASKSCHAVKMLQAGLGLLKSQEPHITSHELRSAWKEGQKFWRDYYEKMLMADLENTHQCRGRIEDL